MDLSSRAELLKRPSGEVAAGPSHPRFRRPRPHPFDDRNQLAPGALGTRPAAHFPPRARSVTQGVVENGYALVFSAPFHTHPSAAPARMSIKVGTFPTTGGGRTPRSTQAACGQKCPPARLGKWPDPPVTETAADGSCLHLSSGSWWPELPSSHLAITCQPRRALRLTPPPGRVREHPAALLRGRHLSTDNQWKKEGAITPAASMCLLSSKS